MLRLLLLLTCCSITWVVAQSPRRFVQIEAVSVGEIDLENARLEVGFHFQQANGRVRKSSNLTLFGVPWRSLNVWVEHGHFEQGIISFDPAKVYRDDHRLRFRVSHADRPAQVFHFVYRIPYPTELRIWPAQQASICPGQTLSLELRLRYSNGFQQERSPSLLRRLFSLDPDTLPVTLQSDARLGEDLRVRLPRTIYFTDSIYVIGSHPWATVSDTLALPVDYGRAQYFDFSGSDGSNEFWGDDGDHGSDGEDVEVWAQRVSFQGREFLRVKVSSANHTEATLVEVGGEGLLIDVSGGDGGEGGDGKDGDDGDDADGDEAAEPGENGEHGGDGGNGGDAGRVRLYTDEATRPYLDLIRYDLRGGDEGNAGEGGEGGDGGEKADGSDQPDGQDGRDGRDGYGGNDAPPPKVILLPSERLNRDLTGLGKS